MKLVIKNSDTLKDKRLSVVEKLDPCLDSVWHYHSEFELLYISSSFGIRFVGDNVSPFSPGDLVLVGSYLPHLWRNDMAYYNDKENEEIRKVKTIVTKFTKDFIGEDTFSNPEFSEIDRLLNESKYGISFGGEVSSELHKDLLELPNLSRPEQSIQLLNILYQLSKTDNKVFLSSTDMRQFTKKHSYRIDAVIKYISDNYAVDMTLNDVAEVACMTTNSFCRFFKKMTNKSFTQFLNEVRIRNASRMLVQENVSVSTVCYAVGYNSITNFNKQFKQIMGATPKDYRLSI
ncbi:AraC family transcriptional regulator [uncultured Aquimarina sp.]|uniref:AraC family transcriptional regulator n=1 Tax=uncultured Aquimarina sp. TaxID=575652 RepID=UPI0026362B7A|nr:AraC family transcriptional regulator [uncultured Aquimarina sp.]